MIKMEGIIIVKKLKVLKQQLSDISQIEKNVDDSITIDEEQMNLLSQKNFVEALYNELESIQIQAKRKKTPGASTMVSRSLYREQKSLWHDHDHENYHVVLHADADPDECDDGVLTCEHGICDWSSLPNQSPEMCRRQIWAMTASYVGQAAP